MLRLHDSRTGRAAPVAPARRGELRTYLAGPARGGPPASGPAAAGGLRSFLLADLIRRVMERRGLLVIAWQNICPGRDAAAGREEPGQGRDGAAGRDGAGLLAACSELNIYPAEYAPAPPDAFDIGIAVDVPAADPAALWVRAAPVLPGQQVATRLPDALTDLAGRGLDPLALRLALLRGHYRRPVDLGRESLADADEALRRWREQVARWATHPSKPMCAQYLADAAGAVEDDLDIPAALRTLDALAADSDIPPGSKFETFAHLDRVLALDLARDVGR